MDDRDDDWDTCCAICGVPWGPFMAEIENAWRRSIKGSPFSTTNLTENDLRWLQRNNALGLWSDSRNNSNVFFTKRFYSGEAGSVTLHELDLDEEPEYVSDIYYGRQMVTYPSFNRPFNRNGVVVFPFHDACYSLLLRVISRYIEGSVDEEILYAVFVQLGNGHKPWILDIDYGDPAPKSNPKTFGLFPRDPTVHHDWWKNYGHETLLKYHGETVDISSYFVQRPKPNHVRTTQTWRILHDPFSDLPVEIREQLLDLLSIQDMSALRTASYPMHNIILSKASWEKIFSTATPWVYEIKDILSEHNKYRTFDLSLTIGELQRRSTYRADFDGLDLTLANRRRVWLICEGMAKQYVRILQDTAGFRRKWTLRNDGSFQLSV